MTKRDGWDSEEKEAEKYAVGGYNEALAKGDQLTDAERRTVIAKLTQLTGLDPKYLDNSNLRVELMHYLREILRDRKTMAGRLDSRLTGPAPGAPAPPPAAFRSGMCARRDPPAVPR